VGYPFPFSVSLNKTSASVRIKTKSSKVARYFSKFSDRYKTNEVEYRRRYKYQHMAVRISVEKLPAPDVLFWLKCGFLSFTVNPAPLKDFCLNETGRLFWVQGACYALSSPTTISSLCIKLTGLLLCCGLLPSSSSCCVLEIGRCRY
jgi:hypothetical protein